MIRDPAEEYGPEPPPCERPHRLSQMHPRYPSGVCRDCGALPKQACRWSEPEVEDE